MSMRMPASFLPYFSLFASVSEEMSNAWRAALELISP